MLLLSAAEQNCFSMLFDLCHVKCTKIVCISLFVSDEPPKKPVPLHEQTVKDEKGRYQRFHGAFTGGFSAGYFNTVGSKEGQS